jgi:5'-nucleotidase
MKFILSNDDGILAPGIQLLAAFLAAAGHSAVVVAPDRERSSIGHALTLNRPLYVREIAPGVYPESVRAFACDGTPSDSVCVGLEEIVPEAEFVLSGINRGPNLGDDITYSGTVMAAMEGVILGRPAMAVSLDCTSTTPVPHYETAAAVALVLLDRLAECPLPPGILLNVNVPDLPLPALAGIRPTRQGVRSYRDKITRMEDPHGRACYWIGGYPDDVLQEGTDVWAVAGGYASVTPVHLDLTSGEVLADLGRNGFGRLAPGDLARFLPGELTKKPSTL